MPTTVRLLVVLLALAVPACTPWGDQQDGAGTDSTTVAVDTTTRPVDTTDAGRAVGGALPVDSAAGAGGDTAAGPAAGPAVGDSGQVAAAAGSGSEAAASTSRDLDEVTRLLTQVAASQLALERRLDSLAARVGGSAGARIAAGGAGSGGPPGPGGAGAIVDAAGDTAVNLGLGIAWSVVLLVLVRLLIGALVWVLDTLAERYPRSRLFWKRLVPVVRIVLWAVTAVFIVRVVFQVDASGIFAAAAAIGVAVGFAAQDLLKNLFGGLILVFDQPFQVGDKISVAGTYGEVVSIGLRSTRMVTPDDNLVSVPNAQVVDGQVANANAGQLNCQVVTDLYLPGVVDEARAKKIAFDAAASSKYVFLNKPIVVLVKDEFKETFLTHLKVKAYVLDPRYEFLFQSDVTERARAGFREAGLMTATHGLRAWLDLSRVGVPEPAADVEPREDGDARG